MGHPNGYSFKNRGGLVGDRQPGPLYLYVYGRTSHFTHPPAPALEGGGAFFYALLRRHADVKGRKSTSLPPNSGGTRFGCPKGHVGRGMEGCPPLNSTREGQRAISRILVVKAWLMSSVPVSAFCLRSISASACHCSAVCQAAPWAWVTGPA